MAFPFTGSGKIQKFALREEWQPGKRHAAFIFLSPNVHRLFTREQRICHLPA